MSFLWSLFLLFLSPLALSFPGHLVLASALDPHPVENPEVGPKRKGSSGTKGIEDRKRDKKRGRTTFGGTNGEKEKGEIPFGSGRNMPLKFCRPHFEIDDVILTIVKLKERETGFERWGLLHFGGISKEHGKGGRSNNE